MKAEGLRNFSDLKSRAAQFVVSGFNLQNSIALGNETKKLAEGLGLVTSINSTQIPVMASQRMIIEALADIESILELVDVNYADADAATMVIAFEHRPKNFFPLDDGVVFENRPIPRSSISQSSEIALVHKTAISSSITNELAFFSQSAGWDIAARQVAANGRQIGEILARRMLIELLRATDAHESVAVSGEDVSGQLTGAGSLIKSAHFPIVRPHEFIDLAGNPMKPTEQAISLTIDGDTIPRFNFSGKQEAGVYWKLDKPTLGFIRVVNELGEPVHPVATTATLDYFKATNCTLFDLDVPAGMRFETHLAELIKIIGARNAELQCNRFIKPDALVCNGEMAERLSAAKVFEAHQRRPGTALDYDGGPGIIRGVPVHPLQKDWGLLNDRIIVGLKGTLKWRIVSLLEQQGEAVINRSALGAIDRVQRLPQPLLENVDSATGRPLGSTTRYCESYDAILLPEKLAGDQHSIIIYDSVERTLAE